MSSHAPPPREAGKRRACGLPCGCQTRAWRGGWPGRRRRGYPAWAPGESRPYLPEAPGEDRTFPKPLTNALAQTRPRKQNSIHQQGTWARVGEAMFGFRNFTTRVGLRRWAGPGGLGRGPEAELPGFGAQPGVQCLGHTRAGDRERGPWPGCETVVLQFGCKVESRWGASKNPDAQGLIPN